MLDRMAQTESNGRSAGWTALVLTLTISLLLLVPLPFAGGGGDPFGIPHGDKLIHLVLFLALAVAWLRVLGPSRSGGLTTVLVVLVGAYGGLLELLQGATGTRTAEWGDFAADALGAALGPVALRLAPALRAAPEPVPAALPAEAQADSGDVASR